VSLSLIRMLLRIAMIAMFQREPPKPNHPG
jgi:hypothetical protein